ncbi:dTDP-4-dehydrorhamnose 3,5-epimerase [Bowmanella denitrificans]|uniref:dTDP-4-dehydrorhamnose 3,5-epimerase n=1 Tax=Bowmanella denitrificans TaxID=366582 RepID=A0ABN0XL75_9ALTE
MNVQYLKIDGAALINLERHCDGRGYFRRNYCALWMKEHGFSALPLQISESFNTHQFTLRGMHLQSAPHEEVKLVSCIKGKLFDVIIDLRPLSKSYLQSYWVELSEFDDLCLYVPKGVAHGFMTLVDNTIIEYKIFEGTYSPEHARGISWNDPVLDKIPWPAAPQVISERDSSYPFLSLCE